MARRKNGSGSNAPGSAMTLSIITADGRPVTPVAPTKQGEPFTGVQKYYPTHDVTNAPKLDVLLVPGGLGTNPHLKKEMDFISGRYPQLKYLITVCTGSLIAAKAGVLNGATATTNKQAWGMVKDYGPDTTWKARLRWVQYGNIWTSSGVSAGTDCVLAWIEHAFENGPALVDEICTTMEYNRVKDASDDSFAAIEWLQDFDP